MRDCMILVLMYNSMYFPNISLDLVTKHPIHAEPVLMMLRAFN
jgi:hypothetical protein